MTEYGAKNDLEHNRENDLENDLVKAVKRQLEDVMDPELPFLSISDMGILRDVILEDGHTVCILTPTYSGCPATDVISKDVLAAAQVVDPSSEIRIAMAPAWTTDWISEQARAKMTANGIAPPVGESHDKAFLTGDGKIIPCPTCKSLDTKLISPFGSTACKASFKCNACLEPFEHFKCI
jgi:ring-1,2-phenylacetyl-CoA epoxidase subunit PaaD